MNDAAVHYIETPTVIGTKTESGTYFGKIRAGGALHALFLPPMAIALQEPTVWNGSHDRVEGAHSLSDGVANTIAMAKAGSKIAQGAIGLGLHIPAIDELDLLYRAFKPTTERNWCYLRSGINLNAETPLEPYTPEFPAQTEFAVYRAGGAEALPAKALWSSSQSRYWDDSAWIQNFYDGYQNTYHKSTKLPVVLVRRKTIR